MKFRCGSMIIELIVMLAVIVIIMTMITKSFRYFLRDTLQLDKDFQTSTLRADMLETLQHDVETAGTVEISSEPNQVIIQLLQAGRIVTYKQSGQMIYRYDNSIEQPAAEWKLPRMELQWQVYPDSQSPRGLSLNSAIVWKQGQSQHRKLTDSRLFFVNKYPGEQP